MNEPAELVAVCDTDDHAKKLCNWQITGVGPATTIQFSERADGEFLVKSEKLARQVIKALRENFPDLNPKYVGSQEDLALARHDGDLYIDNLILASSIAGTLVRRFPDILRSISN